MAENDTDRNEPCVSDIDDTAAPAYRMSRGRVALLAVLAILPVVLTALAQPFLPDSVPLHYGASGPDRWGSKGELFVAAGIITVIAFVLVTVYAVVEHQRETGREDWLVVDGPVTSMFPVFSICLAIIDCLDAAYVFAAFQLGGFSMPESMGSHRRDRLPRRGALPTHASPVHADHGQGPLARELPSRNERPRETHRSRQTAGARHRRFAAIPHRHRPRGITRNGEMKTHPPLSTGAR